MKKKMPSILLVDDDPIFAAFAARILEQHGHHVLVAAEGYEALKLLDEHGPALVITDIVMPGMEGLEAISEMRRLSPRLKIIAISGREFGHLDILNAAKQIGADAALKKPFQDVELIEIVDRVLGSALYRPPSEQEDPTGAL
jgi:two-component system, response regulator, stage 0 sporulation protein F